MVIKRSVVKKKTTPKIVKRNRRVALYGSFSGDTSKIHKQVADILGRKKLTLVTGGRLGPVKDVVERAIGKGAKNISVILEPWGETFNPNIKGKARNITIKSNQKVGSRELHERLSALQTSKVKAYLFLPSEKKQFSGTMLELHALVNAFALESMTNSIQRRPIILIGSSWKTIYSQLKKDYSKQWPKIGRYIRVVENPEQLKKLV